MIFSNSSADFICVCATMFALICWPRTTGNEPIEPAATCAFCAWMAAVTSDGTNWNCCILSGSSQMRIA